MFPAVTPHGYTYPVSFLVWKLQRFWMHILSLLTGKGVVTLKVLNQFCPCLSFDIFTLAHVIFVCERMHM